MRSAALRKAEAPRAPAVKDWYEGHPKLEPAVELAAGRAVVCPFCSNGVHLHDRDGVHAPGCNGPRAEYEARAMPPAEFVTLMLQRLGFAPEAAREILAAIAARDAHLGAARQAPAPSSEREATENSFPRGKE